ncbi:efflux RND transporter periplasmic adaptor subunit [Myxococcota bacterium]|nr:efflux RND transporter periplasmic adaptor subunit [Myxococcota bacterium]
MSSPRSGLTVLQVVVPIAILLAGGAAAAALFSLRPEAEQAPLAEVAMPVEVSTLQATTAQAHVGGTGTVSAEQQVVLTPQVGGRLVSVSEALRPGGRVRQGEVLARIDARDFENAVTQAESQVAQARVNLELEKSRGAVAEREWALVGEGRSAEEAPLALRRPQLASAQAALASAEATLATARLNLERTSLRAPFDAIVLSEGVDVGQVVGAATQVATLVGTARLRVEVRVPVEALAMLEIPGMGAEQGSTATVTQRLTTGGAGSQAITRPGRVVGLGGQIDAATRSATVLVGIEDPLGDGSGLPLLPGAYVEVDVQGRPVEGAIAVPRVGIREGTVAWVVGAEDRLERRDVTVGWRSEDRVFVTAGLQAGDRVVTSPLSLPVPGMAVRITTGPGEVAP